MPGYQRVPSANTVTIHCTVSGAPSSGVTYQWLDYYGVPLANNFTDTAERVSGTNTSTVTIINVGIQDSYYNYTCVVSVNRTVVESDQSYLDIERK